MVLYQYFKIENYINDVQLLSGIIVPLLLKIVAIKKCALGLQDI